MMTITKQDIKNAAEVFQTKMQDHFEAKQTLIELQDGYAAQVCPLSVGDIVDVIGWPYNGKKMKINRIKAPRYKHLGDWAVVGIVLKKDGSEGKNAADFSQCEYEERQREQEGK